MPASSVFISPFLKPLSPRDTPEVHFEDSPMCLPLGNSSKRVSCDTISTSQFFTPRESPLTSPRRLASTTDSADDADVPTQPTGAPTSGAIVVAPKQPLLSFTDRPDLLPTEAVLRRIRDALAAKKEAAVAEFLQYAKGMNGWIDCGTIKGARVQRREFHDGLPPMIRGTVNFGSKFTPWDFLDFLRDWDAKKATDDQFGQGACLCEFDYYTAVAWMMFKGMMMYEPRDFIQALYTHVVAPGTVAQVAVSTDDYPEPSGLPKRKAVRAKMILAGFLCESLPDGTMDVTLLAQVELKVKVPNAVISRMPFFLEQPAGLVKARKYMEKNGVKRKTNRPTDYSGK
ncbi:unnamed protein product [Vitrella brassicaformis CCMP3155]|uniref:START domain-containing protein n=1 Tax=Vitrella brassicaformis (strain CCMP3155) TaxID=1169540 RepID=A0A0G4GMW6_VITBC|nr:unnamed protein product [Vitrella brassicaformis CCMP3155]|eukprot:CEM31542.1 unnamed protein product [Vitrella brassicaformis CCMP3155]